ncbi:MAG: trigger factor [SAR202 cluster bacterium]|nr:trigger factor [SAR202 cluster bacterium]
MKITQEEIVDSQTIIHIELEDPDLSPYLDQGYRKVVQQVAIPGFRKGKAPRRIVETFIGRESLLNEVLDTMVSEVTDLAIKEQDIDAAGLPSVEMVELDPFTLKATVPIRPEVDLGDYNDIRVDFEPEAVTDGDVDGRVEEIQQSLGTWEEVERPIEFGDLVTLRVVGKVDDTAVIDQEDGVFFLDEDSANPLPGFAQEMVGAEAGQSREFTLAIPDDYRDPSVAGQECSFEVEVKDIKARDLPEIDDEFAKGLPEAYENLEALKTSVHDSLREEADNRANRHYEELVTEALLEVATIELSPVMVEHEIDHIEENQMSFLQQLNIRRDDYLQSIGKTAEEQREESRGEAEKRIRRTFALNKLSEAEDIEIEDSEIDDKIAEMVEAEGPDAHEGHDHSSEDHRDSVSRMLKYEKAVARLVEIAKGESEAESEADESTEDQTEEDQTTREGGGDDDDSEA